ncbi:PA0069 family radical SAM protein [Salinisphaera sp. P385]|uniref:PA0069 family radical SAM protein n=1 Tax=Spectribacter acetivorans TaxID=3075603 RepID=A0ABU3BBK6_9GAMM|nr:PA0069 family radical SAM protein [Salinisphaera sp. P385]MDT0619503.1 PA0069 family radical SAM protein [Salinisphaera sp. P385]
MAARHQPNAAKGRGATGNRAGRFARDEREAFDDGWPGDDEEAGTSAPATIVRADPARRLISRNQSPDIPFDASINPYRGCEHGCPYCLDGDTPILMADGRHRPLRKLQVGDIIIGTQRDGWYRRYVPTRVRAHWSSRKPAFRVTLADGTVLNASSDHRFLTERGWKHVTPPVVRGEQRPYLTGNNKLMGTGRFSAQPVHDTDYRRGYLTGMLRGDGHLGRYIYDRPGRGPSKVYRCRLALKDADGLQRSHDYLHEFGVATKRFVFQQAAAGRAEIAGLRASSRQAFETVHGLIDWPTDPSGSWRKGFVAGLFDAEGHRAGNNLRISNSDPAILGALVTCLDHLGFTHCREHGPRPGGRDMTVIRLVGGLGEQMRFIHTVDPAIRRKCSPAGIAIKSEADLGIRTVERLPGERELFDITTGTGDFIANGVVSHNCFARPSHSYLDLSPGLDFETRIFYKENAAALLESELRKPGYQPTPISLGINTDAYQPVEKRLRVTRDILEVLAAHRHPVSLLTKSRLILRDMDILGDMAADNLVSAAVSITTLDASLKRILEPRTASPAARLDTVRQLAAAGVPTSVMAAPVIPAITDHELEAIVQAASEHGARGAGYVLLRLPWEVKQIFRDWLAAHFPDRAAHVMSLIQQSRGGRDYDAAWGQRLTGTGKFADLIAQRFALACRKNGLNRSARPNLTTEHFRLPPRTGDQLPLL